MRKRLFISAVSLLLTGVCYAQWSAQDSLKLQNLLEGSEELKLNPKAVKQIDFGGAVGTPRMSEEKRCCPMSRFPKHCLNRKLC